MSEVIPAVLVLLGLVLCAGPLVLAVRSHRRIWIAAGVVWLLVALIPFSALAVPELTFWAAWARCGHQPVITSTFAASYSYDLPGDYDYGPSLLTGQYFCTESQAQQAGYHRGLGVIK